VKGICSMSQKNEIIYKEAFKKMIVDLYDSKQTSVSQLEREYGISKVTIYDWIRKYSKIQVDAGTTITNNDINEMSKEMAKLKEENEILKKAMAKFTKKS
jgi:transposase